MIPEFEELNDLKINIFELLDDNSVKPLYNSYEKKYKNVKIIRCYSLFQKSKNKYLRVVSEFLTPYLMQISLIKHNVHQKKWDMVIWYSPTIFLGHVISKLRLKHGGCKYLILRDIFPEWAVHLGIIDKKSVINYFFQKIARKQYLVADKIGIQAISDINILRKYEINVENTVHLLENWVTYRSPIDINIEIKKIILGKKVAIYAGNMGIAQNAIIFVRIAEYFLFDKDIIFIFIGRGEQKCDMEELARSKSLVNVLFFDEVPTESIYGYYEKATVGLLSLDGRHKTSNIPGKFISYIAAGLPVYAVVNKGNDLINIINTLKVGKANIYDSNIKYLSKDLEALINNKSSNAETRAICKNLYMARYTTTIAVDNILSYSQINNEI
jgi:hypothetical protein